MAGGPVFCATLYTLGLLDYLITINTIHTVDNVTNLTQNTVRFNKLVKCLFSHITSYRNNLKV